MRILSTQLNMTVMFTLDDFFEIIIKWLKEESPSQKVGELLEEVEDKTSVRLVEGYCTIETVSAEKNNVKYNLVRLSHIYHDQTWNTEVILQTKESQKVVYVHVECQGNASRFDDVPAYRSRIIRRFVESGYIRQERLPIQCKPIEASNDIQDILVSAINGEYSLPYPLVYVTKLRNTMGYEVNLEALSRQLGGLAHVVVETDDDYSYALKELTDGANPYGGRIGLYYKNGKPKVLRAEDSMLQPLERMIVGEVVKAVTAQIGKTSPTWEEFYRDKLERESKESFELMMQAIDANDSLEDKLKKAREQIHFLTESNRQLMAKNESLVAALTAKSQDTLINKSTMEEWYEGEQNDLLVTVMQKALRDLTDDSRAYELLSDLVSINAIKGEGKPIFDRLKAILSKGEILTDRDFRDLKELGFEITTDSTHYRLRFKENELYKFTIPKTPSDYRVGKNNVSDLTKRLSIYK